MEIIHTFIGFGRSLEEINYLNHTLIVTWIYIEVDFCLLSNAFIHAKLLEE